MTLSEIRQAIYDVLGVTGNTTMVERCINEAKNELCAADKWWWLETSSSLALTTSTREYTLGTTAGPVIEVLDADSKPLEKVHRDTYRDLYRASTETATTPSVYTLYGAATTGAPKIHVWPAPTALSTATVRHVARVPDLATSADIPQHIPTEYHFAIVKGAVARIREWENDPAAPTARQEFMQMIDSFRSREGLVVQEEKT